MTEGNLVLAFAQFEDIEIPINHGDAVGSRIHTPECVAGESGGDIGRQMGLMVVVAALFATVRLSVFLNQGVKVGWGPSCSAPITALSRLMFDAGCSRRKLSEAAQMANALDAPASFCRETVEIKRVNKGLRTGCRSSVFHS